MISNKSIVIIGAIACFVTCIGDFLVIFLFGPSYPGYNQLMNTMSSLGATVSPVSNIVSTCWIVLGFVFVVFALGFRQAFAKRNKYVSFAFWLLVIYGLGELVGSGIFKADHIGNTVTTSAIFHGILGSTGVAALYFLPVVMIKIFPRSSNPGFYRYSLTVLLSGIVLLVLFNFRFSESKNNFIDKYEGLWQRLFVLDYYIYLMLIAIRMLRKQFDVKNNLVNV